MKNSMNGTKIQGKLRKVIEATIGSDHSIDPRRLRSMGYNIIRLTYHQTTKDGHIKDAFKPKAPKGSLLVLIREQGSEDKKEFTYERFWVEIPREMVTSILALNHLPDLNMG